MSLRASNRLSASLFSSLVRSFQSSSSCSPQRSLCTPQSSQRCIKITTGKARWTGSAAEKLLKLDVNAEKHRELKPKDLYASRVEYQHFSLDEFRKHIHQEASSRLQKSYWLARKAKKEEEKKKACRNSTDF